MIPSYMQAVKVERERPVVMAVLEALTGVLRACGNLALQPPGRLSELCTMLKTVLQKKVSRGEGRLWAREGIGPRKSPPHHRHRGKETAGEPPTAELCLPQTACQDTEEEEEDEEGDQVRATDESRLDHRVPAGPAVDGALSLAWMEGARAARKSR